MSDSTIDSSRTNINSEEFSKYAQDAYYTKYWGARTQSERPRKLQFNIYAYIFGNIWCFYRKLWFVGIAYFVAFYIIWIIFSVFLLLLVPDITESKLTVIAIIFEFTVFRPVLALWANELYARKATKVINKLRDSFSGDELNLALRKHGGTSGFGLLVGLGINYGSHFIGQLLST